MFNKLIAFFKPKQEYFIDHIKLRSGIDAIAMETYKGVTVVYLLKPQTDPTKDPATKQPIYHLYYKRQFYYDEAPTLEELEALAHTDIDNKFKNKETI